MRIFLAALAHMPDASGVALGFDRLVMLATGAQRIDHLDAFQVIPEIVIPAQAGTH